jgi:hypothetical protein
MQQADAQAACCKALRGLRLEGNAAADAIDAIVAALRHDVNHATLQHNGWSALSELTEDSADNCESAAAAGAVYAIVAGLRVHPGDAGVRLQASLRSCI